MQFFQCTWFYCVKFLKQWHFFRANKKSERPKDKRKIKVICVRLLVSLSCYTSIFDLLFIQLGSIFPPIVFARSKKKKKLYLHANWMVLWPNVILWMRMIKSAQIRANWNYLHRLCFPLVLKSKVLSVARMTHTYILFFFRYIICIWQRL